MEYLSSNFGSSQVGERYSGTGVNVLIEVDCFARV
jgi:hypothetical protein